jgi:hypothetical protein
MHGALGFVYKAKKKERKEKRDATNTQTRALIEAAF